MIFEQRKHWLMRIGGTGKDLAEQTGAGFEPQVDPLRVELARASWLETVESRVRTHPDSSMRVLQHAIYTGACRQAGDRHLGE